MTKIKIISLLAIVLGFTQCKSVKFDKHPPFNVNGASFNNWFGGQPGVSGMKVIIAYDATTKIEFDSIFFANRKTKIELSKMKDKTYIIGHFNTSNVNSREDLILHKDTNKEMQNNIPQLKKIPFELKENEAVISFIEGDKTKYVKIKNIKQTQTDFYP